MSKEWYVATNGKKFRVYCSDGDCVGTMWSCFGIAVKLPTEFPSLALAKKALEEQLQVDKDNTWIRVKE